MQKSSNLNAAIAGAQAAATQFSKKDQSSHTTQNITSNGVTTRQMKKKLIEEDKTVSSDLRRPSPKDLTLVNEGKANEIMHEGSASDTQPPCADSRPHSGAPSKVC